MWWEWGDGYYSVYYSILTARNSMRGKKREREKEKECLEDRDHMEQPQKVWPPTYLSVILVGIGLPDQRVRNM